MTTQQPHHAPGVLDLAWLTWPGHPRPTLARPGQRRGTSVREWYVLPRTSDARLFVPVGFAGADRMLVRHGGGRLARTARAALQAGIRTGWLARTPLPRVRIAPTRLPEPTTLQDARSMEELAASVLGHPVVTGVLLGPPRLNRKPVVEVFHPDGDVAAFAKVAVNELTTELVRSEQTNLERLAAAGLTGLRIPKVLHAGHLAEHRVLMLDVLHSSQDEARQTPTIPLGAMADLAGSMGSGQGRLRGSSFLARLRAVTEATGEPRLGQVLTRIEQTWPDATVHWGCWHGDWAPWNMGVHAGTIEVWDWERFEADVPWGFDAVHFRAQSVRHLSEHRGDDERSLRQDVGHLLAGTGTPGAEQDADLVLLLYLVSIAARLIDRPAHGRTGEVAPQRALASAAAPRAAWAIEFAEGLLADG